MKRVILISFCFCSLLLFVLTGCGKQEPKNVNNKLNAELEYVEDLIFKIAIKHAKQEYLEDDKINWQWIKDDVGRINDTWPNLILDLTEVDVQNQDIIGFSNELNQLLISMANEDEQSMMRHLNEMYKKIIIFKQAYSENKNQIQKNKIKSGVLGVYNLATQNDWTTAKTEVDAVLENYKNLMNDIQYAEENSYNLNKIYVLLEEYKVSIQTQNYNLVRMKYITTVEEL